MRRWPGLRFGKFALVGLLGTALQLLLMWLLSTVTHLSVVTSTALAVELVVLHNFLLHQRFTWSDRQTRCVRERAARFFRFQAGNGLTSLVGNTALTYCFIELFKAPALVSALIAIAVCSLINFLVAEYWVY